VDSAFKGLPKTKGPGIRAGGGVSAALGAVTGAWQCGQGPVTPAAASGASSTCWQAGQANRSREDRAGDVILNRKRANPDTITSAAIKTIINFIFVDGLPHMCGRLGLRLKNWNRATRGRSQAHFPPISACSKNCSRWLREGGNPGGQGPESAYCVSDSASISGRWPLHNSP
jgi:hypothetical protein